MKPTHPAYIHVHNSLKESILSGEFPANSFLPPESDLEKIYNVSRTTVRRAIEMLAQANYVEVTQGRGTMVLDQSEKSSIGMLSSIYKTLTKNGLTVRPRTIYTDVIPASEKIGSILDITPGDDVLRIQRIQLADEIPISIIVNYINPELVPDFDRVVEGMNSLYKLLEDEYSLKIDSTHDIISAKAADFTEAELLQVKCGEPLITIERKTFSNNKPLTYDDNKIRADMFQYEIKH